MKTIAIIDDDMHIGNMLEELLTKEGYGVLRAYSGTESSLKIHVSNLRGKLRDVSGKDYIKAVWGIGFNMARSVLSISRECFSSFACFQSEICEKVFFSRLQSLVV